MTIAELNLLPRDEVRVVLARCCGASQWVAGMLDCRPFANAASLHEAADEIWAAMNREDIFEAFSHHPQIGADLENLRKKFAATATWSAGEQAGVAESDDSTLEALAQGNRKYLAKFGYIFIVCATGKTASQMLLLLTDRLKNDPEIELKIAAEEHAKIMHIRLDKLLEVQSPA